MNNGQKAFLVAVLLVAMSPTYALTGGEILEKCKASISPPPNSEPTQKAISRFLDAGTCAGYVGGVLSGVDLVGSMMQQQKLANRNFICVPTNIHSQLLLKEVVEYIEKNPKEKGTPAQLVIYQLFSKKYPCTANASKTR